MLRRAGFLLVACALFAAHGAGQSPDLPQREPFLRELREALTRSQQLWHRYTYKERRTDLHLNPFYETRKDPNLAEFAKALAPFGFKFSFAADAIPSYSFESTLKAGGMFLRSLRVPDWVLQRVRPLSGLSVWEERWRRRRLPCVP